MTILLEKKLSENGMKSVSFEWEKPNHYCVVAIQKVDKDSPYATEIRRSRNYSMDEHDKAKACFKRYCKRYL